MIGPSFEAVLAAAADGDELAFRAIWRDLQPALLRYLNAFAPGSGEDLASETWLRVVKGLPSFSGDERAFRAWVFTIARHRAVDRWRRGTRRHDELVPLDALAHLPAPDDPAGTVVDAISGQAAVAMIAALPRTRPRSSSSASSPGSTSPRSLRSPASAPATSASSPTEPSAAWPSSSPSRAGSGVRCRPARAGRSRLGVARKAGAGGRVGGWCNGMGGPDVFPAEMPEDPSPIVPLDADTAERLLSGRLDPDDAPGYAEVARVLQAAAGPAEEAELADEEIAANQFHTARRRRPEARSPRFGAPGPDFWAAGPDFGGAGPDFGGAGPGVGRARPGVGRAAPGSGGAGPAGRAGLGGGGRCGRGGGVDSRRHPTFP